MQKNADQVEKDILETQSKLKKVKLEPECKKHAVSLALKFIGESSK